MNDNNKKHILTQWEKLCERLFRLIQLQQHTGINSEAESHKEDIKRQVFARIKESPFSDMNHTVPSRANKRTFSITWSRTMAVAASLAILFVLSGSVYMISSLSKRENLEIAMINVVSPKGATSHFNLPDGTAVTLNANSQLEYPAIFNKKNKKIKLNGEAYFDVTPQEKDAPLVIQTKNLDTHILGTQFNLKAYSDDKNEEIQLTLIKGKVMGEIKDGDRRIEQIELLPNQQLSVNSITNEFSRKNVEAKDFALWTEGIIAFRYANLQEIVSTLERRFNTSIRIDSQCIHPSDKYFATFEENQPLDEILEILSFKRDWMYIKNKNFYRIIQK